MVLILGSVTDNEIDLLKWLVKYEHLYYELILLCANIVTEESLQTVV